MFIKATVIVSHDPLNYTEYSFSVIDKDMVLDNVSTYKRESTRKKKFEETCVYARLSRSDNLRPQTKVEPEVPVQVINDALEHVRKQIIFKRWNRG